MNMEDNGWEEFFNMYQKSTRRSFRFDNMYEKLLALYNTSVRKKISSWSRTSQKRQDIEQSLDLLNAVFEYRRNPDMELFLRKNQDLEEQRQFVHQLWREFRNNTEDDFYRIISDMFKDIDRGLGND